MTTNLRDLIDAAVASGSTVPAEVAAFVALEVTERLAERPTRISPMFVEVSGEGEVTLASSATAALPDAMRAVGRLLSEMVAGENGVVPPGLEEVVRRTADGGADAYSDLGTLQRDLEAYLVPLNRGAARRVLARYLRDVLRESVEPPASAESTQDGTDLVESAESTQDGTDLVESAESTQDGADLEVVTGEPAPLDDLLDGLGPPPDESVDLPPPPDPLARTDHQMEPLTASRVPDVGSLLDALDATAAPPADGEPDLDPRTEVLAAALPAETIAAEPSTPEPLPVVPTLPPRGSGSSITSVPLLLPDVAEPRPRRGFGMLLVTVLLLLAALGAVLYQARPELFGGAPASASTRRSRTPDEAPRAVEYGSLSVTSTPPGAEVLLFCGRGPVEVTNLPVGVPHEFVAIADDGRVARGLVPADMQFSPARGGADPVSTDLAIQLPSGETQEDATWPPTNLRPGAPTEGTGQLGTVRVVTNPLGAKVYLVAGWTPIAPITNLRLDEAYELLVVKEGHARERVVVGRSDWHKVEGSADFTHEAAVTLREDEPAPAPHRHHRRRRHR